MTNQFRCIVHGSFSKHFNEIKSACNIFKNAGVDVLAPKDSELIGNQNGFAVFEDELGLDPRYIELKYLHNLRQLGEYGFSYFVNPEGYIGKSASYELGIAQITNTRCFFRDRLKDHPAYIHDKSIWSPEVLVDYLQSHLELPIPHIKRNERYIHKLWVDLMVPGSVVAAGAIIEFQPNTTRKEKDILLVKTHKWNNRYSIVGGKVRRNERLEQALIREIKEETGLKGQPGSHICTFDQISGSGYYKQNTQHIFVDNVFAVETKRVLLNEEAQDYLWVLPAEALKHLDIEPNARKTIELYSTQLQNVIS